MSMPNVKAYFNHAGMGRPCPRVAQRLKQAEQDYAGLLFSENGVHRLEDALDNARVAALALIDPGQSGGISLMPNSSTALNLAISIAGAALAPGDLAVTTDQEHPCVASPLSRLGARGIEIVVLGGTSPADFLENLSALVRCRRPGFAVFSQVSYKDGRVLPVAEAGAVLQRYEIPYIVDGAQAVGQLPVEVERIGAWAYAFTGHKWLFGPMGTGGLWTNERFLRSNTLAWTGPAEAKRRGGGELESGSLNFALISGMAEALEACAKEFHSRVRILEQMRARISGMLDQIYENTSRMWEGPHAPGILAYALPPHWRSDDLARRTLDRFGVAIKALRPPHEPNGFRVGFSPWTNNEEIELLGEAMRGLAHEAC